MAQNRPTNRPTPIVQTGAPVSNLTSRLVKLQGGLLLRAVRTTDLPVHAASSPVRSIRSVA